MGIMFAGDIHGNENHLQWVFAQAQQQDVRNVVAVGDFGYWPHYPDGREFISLAGSLAMATGITMFFVDGNHENHDVLHDIVEENGSASPIRITGDLWYIPRGCITDIDGRTVMGYGGAVSVDRDHRTPGRSWWDRERISVHHVDALPSTTVDILVTHEAPEGEVISYKDVEYSSVFEDSRFQRTLVSDIAARVTPTFHVCGHHHVRRTWKTRNWNRTVTTVHVLNCDGSGRESILVL